MARYQVTLAYDGTDFLGFQRQGSQRTVQSAVEAALRKIGWSGSSILAAGRTDSGVHASGQVIAFDLDWAHSSEALGRALNANLPKDVAGLAVQIAEPEFHPRYDARVRSYQYRIYVSPDRNPLLERYAWRVWPKVEPQKLVNAARLLNGTHDFAAFGTPPRLGGSTIRTVFHAGWVLQAGGLLFEVSGNAFLYHMVRRLVYLQVLTGQGRIDLEEWRKAVHEAQPQTPGLAPSQGLTLTEVRYTLTEQEKQVYSADGIRWETPSNEEALVDLPSDE
jgi:tRNA pseudouridine38-40 synthase